MGSNRLGWPAVTVALAVALAVVVVRVAWVSDDAYITLRTVDNWLNGHGPVWNVAERAQTYTHPLWMLLLTAAIGLTGDSFYTTIALGGLLSLLAAWLLARPAGAWPAAAATLALLLASRAFVDYSTSGLETPLVAALLAAFAVVATAGERSLGRLRLAALLTGLLALTRMDLILLAGPALAGSAIGLPRPRALLAIGLGLLPFGLWFLFATVYYGTPFPVTAYAKAFQTGIPALDLFAQGCWYLLHSLRTDPLTIAVLVAGCTAGLRWPALRCRMLAVGVLCYSAYVLKVGGDFMQGRFFVPSFAAALAILARALGSRPPGWSSATLGLAALLLFVPGAPTWLRAPADDQPPTTAFHGIVDERCFYYWQQGLLSPDLRVPQPGITSASLRAIGRQRPVVTTHGQIGRYAYEAGDLFHFVDPWLCDPLLMRLPTWNLENWRIGHFIRRVPEGYLETVAGGGNRIVDPRLRRYYEALRTIMRAPVFDRDRLAVTWRMLRGGYDDDLRAYLLDGYRQPPRLEIAATDLGAPLPPGTPWSDAASARAVGAGGLLVRFDVEARARALHVQLTSCQAYEFAFRLAGRQLATVTVQSQTLSAIPGDPLLHELRVDVPAEVTSFDGLWVDAPSPNSERTPCIGSVVLER